MLLPVTSHLLSGGELGEVVGEGFCFNDAPRRLLPGDRLIFAALNLFV